MNIKTNKSIQFLFIFGTSVTLLFSASCRDEEAQANKVHAVKTGYISKQSVLPLAADESLVLKAENVLAKQHKPILLRNPTWNELKDFLREDLTNEKIYDLATYNCKGFTLELRDHARDLDWRSAFVSVSYKGQTLGHAFNAFETADEGLVYIEPQHDSVKYVELGRTEGAIDIEAVKREFFACENPDDLRAETLTTVRYSKSLFEYAYYETYEQRMACWIKSFEAYREAQQERNKAIDSINDAVNAYNSGTRTRAEAERLDRESALLNKELSELNKWSENLRLFAADIGRLTMEGAYLMPPDTSEEKEVGEIEKYWN